MTTQDPIVIAGMARTAIGSFQGAYTGVATPKLGSAAISAALERAGVKAADVDEVLMGCVLPAGLGQAPAAGLSRRGRSDCGGLHDPQQDVRLRHESRDVGA